MMQSTHAHNFLRPCRWGLFLLGAILSGVGGAHAQTTPERVNTITRQCGAPRIAYGGDQNVFAVWAGYEEADGPYHIWFSERRADGVWSRETRLSEGLAGDSRDPAMAVDSQGYPHVVWSSEINGVHHIFYSRRRGQGDQTDWSVPRQLNDTSDLNCQFPSIGFDGGGRAIVLWQAGRGATHRIYGAWAPYRGAFRVSRLDPATAHDCSLFPQLIIGPTVVAVWYETTLSGWKINAAEAPGENGGAGWRLLEDLEGLANLPADRMPALVSDYRQNAWAMWIDSSRGMLERILMARVPERNRLPGALYMDDRPDETNRMPSAAFLAPDRLAICWVAQRNGENRIAFRSLHPATAEGAPSRIVSRPDDPYVSTPALSLQTDHPDGDQAHIIWYSDLTAGGDGGVYYNRVALD